MLLADLAEVLSDGCEVDYVDCPVTVQVCIRIVAGIARRLAEGSANACEVDYVNHTVMIHITLYVRENDERGSICGPAPRRVSSLHLEGISGQGSQTSHVVRGCCSRYCCNEGSVGVNLVIGYLN